MDGSARSRAGRRDVRIEVWRQRLVNLDLRELIANSPEEYAEIAVQMAADPGRLQALRSGLRERMRVSPLLDAAGFTRNLEQAYRDMWASCA